MTDSTDRIARLSLVELNSISVVGATEAGGQHGATIGVRLNWSAFPAWDGLRPKDKDEIKTALGDVVQFMDQVLATYREDGA